MGWGWFDRPHCKACWGFVAKATSQHCDVCQREAAAIDGVCRLCRRQAGLIAGPDKRRVDLTVATRIGQQLFILGTLRPRGGLPPRANDQRPEPEPLGGRLHGVQPRWTEPSLFEIHRDLSGVSSLAPLLDPELATALSSRAIRIAELRGWPSRTLGSMRRGIRILCTVHRPGEVIRASTITQLTHTAVPANHVLEVFEHLEIFLDDRPDSLDAWCETHFTSLAPDIRAEPDIWINILRHGTSPQTTGQIHDHHQPGEHPAVPYRVRGKVHNTASGHPRRRHRMARPPSPSRINDASALRGLFRTLKAERLVFANPTRDVRGGKLPVSIPLSPTSDEVESVAQAALQEPALLVVVALSGIHALPAHRIRSLLLEEVDLPGRRLDPEDLDRPLDAYTAEAITDCLDYRRRRWPNSANPHLLISRATATTTAAVGMFWMDKLVKQLPVSVDRLRQDRILEEALANGADPLHLAHVFSLAAKTSLRYTSAVAISATEQDSRPR